MLAQHAAAIFRTKQLLERVAVLRAQEETARLKDAFLASVTHDLKTPLTSIKAVAQWARRQAGRPGSEEAATLTRDMRRIEAAVDRMTGLVNELLDVSRIQMGRPLELSKGPTDLVANSVLITFSPGPSVRLAGES